MDDPTLSRILSTSAILKRMGNYKIKSNVKDTSIRSLIYFYPAFFNAKNSKAVHIGLASKYDQFKTYLASARQLH